MPLTQQESDIRCFCELAGVSVDEWPAKPSADAVPHPTEWARMPPKTRCRAKEMVDAMRWTEHVGVGYYVLIVLAKRLPGWRFANGRDGYIKEAGRWIRRTLLATRGITKDHPVARPLCHALGVSMAFLP